MESGYPKTLEKLLEQVEDILTDSKHPLDDKQSRMLSLMLQQQTALVIQALFNETIEIRRTMVDVKVEIVNSENLIDQRIARIETHILAYPSITYLLRHRTKETVLGMVGVITIIMVFLLTYQDWLFTRLGLPPLILP